MARPGWRRRSRSKSSTRGRTSKVCDNNRFLSRLFDQQRVHFAKLQNQQAENYFQNLRDMTKAAMETNKVIDSHKRDHHARLREEELQQDRQELDVAYETRKQYVESSDMHKYNV